jgi:hypothetical protein
LGECSFLFKNNHENACSIISLEATCSISCMGRLYAKRKFVLLQVALIFYEYFYDYWWGPHPHLMGDTNLYKAAPVWSLVPT